MSIIYNSSVLQRVPDVLPESDAALLPVPKRVAEPLTIALPSVLPPDVAGLLSQTIGATSGCHCYLPVSCDLIWH